MNREQRRATAKANHMAPNEEIVLKAIVLEFTNGKTATMDLSKVKLVDIETGEDLFKLETKEL